MKANLNGVTPNSILGGVVPDPTVSMSFEDMSQKEAQTIFFALTAYADSLRADLEGAIKDSKTNECSHEDQMFLHKSLYNVEAILFEMVENHPTATNPNYTALKTFFPTTDIVRRWLDCI
jgi:hypothetical protein